MSISRRMACDGLFRKRGCCLVGGEQTKIDRLLPIVVETEQIPNRLNFPLNSRARISDGSWIRCFEVRRKGFRSQIKALSCTRTIEGKHTD